MTPQQVRKVRKPLGMTQQTLADFIGCRQHTVARWETGVMVPQGANLKALKELAQKAKGKMRGR